VTNRKTLLLYIMTDGLSTLMVRTNRNDLL